MAQRIIFLKRLEIGIFIFILNSVSDSISETLGYSSHLYGWSSGRILFNLVTMKASGQILHLLYLRSYKWKVCTISTLTVLFFFKKCCGIHKWHSSRSEKGEVLVIPIPGKRVLEHHSSLHPSEKELLEWHSGTFHHKNSPTHWHCECMLQIF
jgi:hypothetical protein